MKIHIPFFWLFLAFSFPVLVVAQDTIQAHLLLEESKTLFNQASYAQALEKGKQAENIFNSVSVELHPLLADAYHQIARCLTHTTELQQSIDYLNKAINLKLRLYSENHASVANSYHTLGVAYYYLPNYELAILNYQKALDIRRIVEGSKHPSIATSYSYLALAYENIGNLDKALEFNHLALELNEELFGADHIEVGNAYNNLGATYYFKEKKMEALNFFKKALIIYEKNNDKYISYSLGNIGSIYQEIGRIDEALDFHFKSLNYRLNQLKLENTPIDISFEKGLDIANTYLNIGNCYNFKGDYELAINYYKKALAIQLNELESSNQDLGLIYGSMGDMYFKTGNYQEALEYLEKARLIVPPQSQNSNISTEGEIYLAMGNYQKAINNYIDAADNIIRYSQNDQYLAKYYAFISLCEMRQGKLEKSHAYLNQSLNLFDRIDSSILSQNIDLAEIIKTAYLLSKIYQERYNVAKQDSLLKQAYRINKKAIYFIEQQFSQLGLTGSKMILLESTRPVFEQTISNAGALYKYKEAFSYLGRSRSMLLYEGLQESNALQFSGLPADLLQQEYDLRVDITYNEKRRQDLISKGASETDTTVLAISGKLFDLKQGYETLKKRFETEYPEYYRLKYDLSTISAEEVQRDLLLPNQAMLEYFVGDSSIFVFVIRPDTLVMQEVKKDFPLEDWVKSLRDNIYQNRTTGATAYAEAAYNLYQKLILPIKSLLPEQVIIIPDGILGYVPFEALLTANPERAIRFNTHPYLLKEHQISYCYSATLLREMQQKKKAKEPTEALLAVAPFYSGDTTLLVGLFAYDETTRKDLAPLQHSGEEVYRINKLWKGDVLTGTDATETSFTERAGDYRILHLATHGRADERVGDYSFLAFSEIKDSVENELLYVRDLYNLQLNADLVVLSACETGLGKLSRGEGIISLARAFAYAGAKSIVTTLWSVDDAKTKDLMVDFYRKLKKGLSKDAALRQAKLDYLTSHTNPADAHPFYWAGFAPIGDMRALR